MEKSDDSIKYIGIAILAEKKIIVDYSSSKHKEISNKVIIVYKVVSNFILFNFKKIDYYLDVT